jgi:hypothetical protein
MVAYFRSICNICKETGSALFLFGVAQNKKYYYNMGQEKEFSIHRKE